VSGVEVGYAHRVLEASGEMTLAELDPIRRLNDPS